jgi:hypothetical protein
MVQKSFIKLDCYNGLKMRKINKVIIENVEGEGEEGRGRERQGE